MRQGPAGRWRPERPRRRSSGTASVTTPDKDGCRLDAQAGGFGCNSLPPQISVLRGRLLVAEALSDILTLLPCIDQNPHAVGIEPTRFDLALQLGAHFPLAPRRLVRPADGQGVIDIGHRDDARLQWN